MKKLTLLLGVLMIAGASYACDGNKGKKACCKKGDAKKECCSKKDSKDCKHDKAAADKKSA